MIDIITAEKVLDLFDKNRITARRKILQKVIHQVRHRRDWIQNYLSIVNILSLQFDKKHESLEKLICQLNDREQRLDQDLTKVNAQQRELERRQAHMQQELRSMRLLVQQLRDKKRQSESHYHRVASVPLLSSQSRKRYLKAHNRNAKAEQQLSEAREALEKCKDQLRTISNARSRQSMEQDLLASQRRGSLDAIKITQQQLVFLQEGSAFWTEFDDDQARVVLESAEYLIALDEKTEASNHEGFDINQLWLKTFRFACFEYGDRESEGLRVWGGPDQTEILFECAQCQLVCTGWPKIANDYELICSLCLESPAVNFMNDLMNRQSRTIESTSRLKKMMRNLFSYSKIEPFSPI